MTTCMWLSWQHIREVFDDIIVTTCPVSISKATALGGASSSLIEYNFINGTHEWVDSNVTYIRK